MKRILSTIAVCVVLAAAAAGAQQNTGQIFGKVTDASDAVLPGVTVTISGPALLQPRLLVTSETGTYSAPGLPIGVYTVKFELGGFGTQVREGVQLQGGFNAQINAQLGIATLSEALVVTGVSPLIDVLSTTQGEHFGSAQLDALPTGRDVASLFTMAPGILVGTKGVGSSTLGAQPLFVSRGAGTAQTRTFFDGVDAGTGNNFPAFYDFDAIEELQFNTGGADVTMQTSGATVNLISKSGTDRFRGSTRFFVTDQSLGSDNITDSLRAQGASSGNPTLNIKDYGFELGGPIKTGRLWYWLALSRQENATGVLGYYRTSAECAPVAANPSAFSSAQNTDCLDPLTAEMKHLNYKLSLSPFRNNQFSFRNSYDLKNMFNFGASDLTTRTATQRGRPVYDSSYGTRYWTIGWPPLWRFADQHTFNDRWMMEVAYGRFCYCINNTFADDSLKDVQRAMEISSGKVDRSSTDTFTVPLKQRAEVTANYFMPGRLGGDHSFKMGFADLFFSSQNASHAGGNVIARFNSGITQPAFTTPFSAQFTRDSVTSQSFDQQSAYLSDTYTRKRFSLTLGLRWDRQTDGQDASTVPASPFQGQVTRNGTVFNFLPAVNFPGVDSGVVFNNVAPRLGMMYDLTGDGKNVIKGSFAEYYDQLGIGQISSTLNTIGATQVEFAWADLNGDKFVQANEVDTSRILSSANYNVNDPAQTVSANRIDPNIRNSRAGEFVVGFSKEMAADVGVSMSYIWRKYTDYIWTPRIGITAANYSPVTFTPAAGACPAGARCEPVTYYVPDIPVPSPVVITNEPDYHQGFNGVEVIGRKRSSHGWMLTGSFAYNDARVYYDSPASYQDPTSIAQRNGAQFVPDARGNANAKWIARLNGSYRIPWQQIGLAAVLDSRQGYPTLATISIASRPNQAGAIQVLLDPPGDVRVPAFNQVDFRVDKTFTLGRTKLQPMIDVFNLFNASTVLAVRPTQNAANANQVSQIIPARVARIGMVVDF